MLVAGLVQVGMPARKEQASFSAKPQAGKLKALMWTATPRSGTCTCCPWDVLPEQYALIGARQLAGPHEGAERSNRETRVYHFKPLQRDFARHIRLQAAQHMEEIVYLTRARHNVGQFAVVDEPRCTSFVGRKRVHLHKIRVAAAECPGWHRRQGRQPPHASLCDARASLE